MVDDTFLIRADSSPDMGAGHQMRCLAIAGSIRDRGGSVSFVSTQTLPLVAVRLDVENIAAHKIHSKRGTTSDAQETISIANEIRADWVVVDGYCFNEDYQHEIKKAGFRLMIIDDLANFSHYFADIILNPNITAAPSAYTAREPYTALCLGTDYALLRKDFLKQPQAEPILPEQASNLFITLGGSGNPEFLETILGVIRTIKVRGLRTTCCLGAAQLSTFNQKDLADSVHFVSDTTEISGYMRSAHIAISSGGGTLWELAYFGIPTLAFIVAENQRPNTEQLARRGAILNMGSPNHLSVTEFTNTLELLITNRIQRTQLSSRFQKLVDGKGALRIVDHLTTEQHQEKSTTNSGTRKLSF